MARLQTETNRIRAASEAELASVRNSLTTEMQSMRMSLQEQLASTRASLQASEEMCVSRGGRIGELEFKVTQLLATITDLECKRQNDEMVRRQLHNVIQELKGNIRVFCRVRPPIGMRL